jgi:transposase
MWGRPHTGLVGQEQPASLDRGGDRHANSALWRIVMVRIAHDPETTAYFERKVKEGRSKRDVIRLLTRYVARELYRYLPRG